MAAKIIVTRQWQHHGSISGMKNGMAAENSAWRQRKRERKKAWRISGENQRKRKASAKNINGGGESNGGGRHRKSSKWRSGSMAAKAAASIISEKETYCCAVTYQHRSGISERKASAKKAKEKAINGGNGVAGDAKSSNISGGISNGDRRDSASMT